jgi:glycosyltransferase involved in cell wall biosynthesis
MKISVVTISYNQSPFIRECIESVINQNYDNIEYIVVDAGSTDGSRGIIENYSNKISKPIFEPDNGPADGLNKGFRAATGDIFGYINADDLLLPEALLFVAEYFKNNPDVDVLCGNGYQTDEHGRVVKKIFSTAWSLKGYAYGAVNTVQQATFFRRTAFESAGGFNLKNRTCWDGELLVDMAIAGARIKNTNRMIGSFRVYDGSISGSGRLLVPYLEDSFCIRRKILGRPENKKDAVVGLGYRVWKSLMNPTQLLYKLAEIRKASVIGKA